jgi:hypothetical protein
MKSVHVIPRFTRVKDLVFLSTHVNVWTCACIKNMDHAYILVCMFC